MVQSGYRQAGISQPDVDDIERRVRQQMGFAPLVQLTSPLSSSFSPSGRIVLEKTFAIDKLAKTENLQVKSPTDVNGSSLITLRWLSVGNQPGLQLVSAPLSP
ncbi:hypothetical protein, partial [Endozoicomonas sp. ONNA1]|uniref:hypothetical protein n=1 Tax=Endozoicomonas sp. ONNA1 TaxID=2828740 RepID=UPI0021497FED